MKLYKQILLYTPLLIASMTGKAQANIDLKNKWKTWENHPIYSFWKFMPDTNTSMNNKCTPTICSSRRKNGRYFSKNL